MMNSFTQKDFFNAPDFADIAFIKRYIAQGGDVSITTESGNNILWHIARSPVPDKNMRSRLIDMAQLLIAHNVSATQTNNFGASAISEAVGTGFFELCALFQSNKLQLTQHITINEFIDAWPRHPTRIERTDFPKTLALLLSEQPDLTVVQEKYNFLTPLQLACKDGKTEAIIQLLNAKADANKYLCPYRVQATPIESLCNFAWRAQRECFDAINILLNAGADPNLFSNDESQPANSKPALIWAVIDGGNTIKVVQRLLAAGARIELKDPSGHDALYWAEQSKRDDLIALLKQRAEI